MKIIEILGIYQILVIKEIKIELLDLNIPILKKSDSRDNS